MAESRVYIFDFVYNGGRGLLYLFEGASGKTIEFQALTPRAWACAKFQSKPWVPDFRWRGAFYCYPRALVGYASQGAR